VGGLTSLRRPSLRPHRGRPEVEVRVDEGWLPAEIRSCSPSPYDWWADCSWRRTPGETHLGTFHEDEVRPDTVDRP